MNRFRKKLSGADENIWNDYYSDELTVQKTTCINCRFEQGKSQHYLDECYFFNFKDKVINIDGPSGYLILHNRCSFNKVTSNGDGGCIKCVFSNGGSIVQRKFCCTKCRCSRSGHFAYTDVINEDLNSIIQGSAFDVGENADRSVFNLRGNTIIVSSTNISLCKTSTDPAGTYTFVEMDSFEGPNVFNYTTVANNSAEYQIISFNFNALIDTCNFLYSKITTQDKSIIIHSDGTLSVKSCSFIGNTAPAESYLILNDGPGSPTLIVDGCYIDDSITNLFGMYGDVEPQNSKQQFINDLNHFSTERCKPLFAKPVETLGVEHELSLIVISLVSVYR